MVSGFIGNEVPRKGLRVRIPCPPLMELQYTLGNQGFPLLFQGILHPQHPSEHVSIRIDWIRSDDFINFGPRSSSD